jgi:hypothetical protein
VWSLESNELRTIYKGTAGAITTVRWNVKKAGLVALGHDDGAVSVIPTATAKVGHASPLACPPMTLESLSRRCRSALSPQLDAMRVFPVV